MTFVYTTNLSEVRILAETQARSAGLAEDRIVDFVIAVSEVAANTVRHAQSPGSMEIWSEAGEIVCEIRDSGVIADPEGAGRQPPAADASGGHGLWLVHQICDKVELRSDSSGTTIRLHLSLSPPGPERRDSPDRNGATSTPDVAFWRTLSLPGLYSIPRMHTRNRARDGFTPSETALSVFSLKEAVYELVAETPELAPEFLAFSRVIDDLGLRTFETYSATREQIITDQSTSMMELSTPVVRLWDGIIAVPLVGTLDSARTQLVMEKLLETLVATGADHAVIDITGVPTVDTEVAQHLLKTVSAARLLGAECTISGIRPQVAQTIVSLGIEFGDIATKATLADALALALRQAGLKVVLLAEAGTRRDDASVLVLRP